MSIPDVAQKHGIGFTRARQEILRAGVKLRTRAEGIALAAWKISRALTGKTRPAFTHGHIEKLRRSALERGDMLARGTTRRTRGYVGITRGANKYRNEHRLIMEQRIGRKLSFNEVVHHRDGNKHNNNPDNLEVMSRAEHTRLHRHLAKFAYAKS